jgi:hypothetical protein
MKQIKLILLLAALPAFWGCASFNSGDTRVDRTVAMAMLEDKTVVPFAGLEIGWRNFPYRAPTDSIGEGSASRPARKIKPVPVGYGDEAGFAAEAREIFGRAGLYDKARGRGTLRLELTTFGRWTYGDLFRSFLVDTGFIFIIPASLRVNYFLAADFAAGGKAVRVETEATNKTTFHLLLAPLYPFLSPGARENGLLRQMLWRSATDTYSSLKAAGVPATPLPPKTREQHDAELPLSGPPVQPDRTWLPGQALDKALPGAETSPAKPGTPDIEWATPDKPAKTWTVDPAPAEQPRPGTKPAPAPAAEPDPDEPADD